jgi:hypothetical protein
VSGCGRVRENIVLDAVGSLVVEVVKVIGVWSSVGLLCW